MWRGTATKLKFGLSDGLEVICRGHVDVYGPRGSYQLVIDELQPKGIGQIRMDGKGRWVDNVFVERRWRRVKYEVYLRADDTPSEANTALARCFRFYDARQPHQGLGDLTPGEVYFGKSEMRQAA